MINTNILGRNNLLMANISLKKKNYNNFYNNFL